jgi:deoxyadenosine/deoxycytidine kinase
MKTYIPFPQNTCIEILGAPASGKTTITDWLTHYTNCRSVDIDKYIHNPFLKENSDDPGRWSFATGLCFSYERAKEIPRVEKTLKTSPVVLDSGFDMGIQVYSKNRYIHHEMTRNEWKLLQSIHSTLMGHKKLVTTSVFIDIPIPLLYSRILKRNRLHEHTYTPMFLTQLHARLNEYYRYLQKHTLRETIVIYQPYKKQKFIGNGCIIDALKQFDAYV